MWGDNNSSINSQYTGWYFNQGDKVTLETNPKTKKLKFYKNSNPDQSYEMPLEFEKKDKLYFCVTLNSSPEEVHIVANWWDAYINMIVRSSYVLIILILYHPP